MAAAVTTAMRIEPVINNKFVYLAGPIDLVSKVKATTWREGAKTILARHGYATFDPAACYANVEKTVHGMTLMEINGAAVDICSIMLARLDEQSIGTCREIDRALGVGTHVFIWSPYPTSRKRLHQSIATVGCTILDEDFLSDGIVGMVREMRKRELQDMAKSTQSATGQRELFAQPLSEEDDPA